MFLCLPSRYDNFRVGDDPDSAGQGLETREKPFDRSTLPSTPARLDLSKLQSESGGADTDTVAQLRAELHQLVDERCNAVSAGGSVVVSNQKRQSIASPSASRLKSPGNVSISNAQRGSLSAPLASLTPINASRPRLNTDVAIELTDLPARIAAVESPVTAKPPTRAVPPGFRPSLQSRLRISAEPPLWKRMASTQQAPNADSS